MVACRAELGGKLRWPFHDVGGFRAGQDSYLLGELADQRFAIDPGGMRNAD
jgi:hypothetical protein